MAEYVMGRDKDPKVPSDLSSFELTKRKLMWQSLASIGPRRAVDLAFPRPIISYYDVKTYPGVAGHIAFTIDDGFCGQPEPGASMLDEVRKLLKKHETQATFFVAGDNYFEHHDEAIRRLVQDGHELANHCIQDRPYDKENAEGFTDHLVTTDQLLGKFQKPLTQWFRPPHAKLSKTMRTVLKSHDKRIIMADCFANDTEIPDVDFITKIMIKHVQEGSIALIHMPERGLREWAYECMDIFLGAMRKRGFNIVTVTRLVELAEDLEHKSP